MLSRITASPLAIRVAPFAVFLALTLCQGRLGGHSQYWFYLAKTVTGALMIWVARPFIQELRWTWSWEAWAVGVGMCVLWIGVDGYYPKLDDLLVRCGLTKAQSAADLARSAWNPPAHFGDGSGWAWLFIGVRLAGSALVVPPLEEVFYRSFLYRYLAAADFQSIPLGLFRWTPFLAVSVFFGFEHPRWLAGILCGLVFQGLVCLKGRLGDAIAAHAITNLLLGLWVVWRGAWQFW